MNHRSAPSYLPNFAFSRKAFWGAALFFIGLLLLMRWEAFVLIGTHYLGTATADAGIYTWLFSTNSQSLNQLPWFNTKAFWPYGLSMAWTDSFILPAYLGELLKSCGFSEIVSYNLLLLSSSYLNGFLSFLFAYRLSNSYLGSLLSGTLLLGSPYLTLHLGHPQLQFLFFLPLVLLLLVSAVNKNSALRYALCGLSITAAFLCSVYYAIFLTILIGVIGLLLCRPVTKLHGLRGAGRAVTGLACGTLPLIPFLLPYLQIRAVFGYRSVIDARSFRADLWSYLATPATNDYVHQYSALWSNPEAMLFPGSIVILAFLITATAIKTRGPRWLYALLPAVLLVCFFLGFWPVLFLLVWLVWRLGRQNRRVQPQVFLANNQLIILLYLLTGIFVFLSFGAPGKFDFYAVLFEYLPGVAAIRAVGRAGIFAVFFATMLLAVCFSYLPKSKRIWIFLPCLLLSLAETYPRFYALENLAWRSGIFAEFSENTPPYTAAIGLPMATQVKANGTVSSWREFATINQNYLNWLHHSDLHLVNGYSGQKSANIKKLPAILQDFPDARSIRQLRSIVNLRYVFFVPAYAENFNKDRFELAISDFASDLELLKTDASGNYLLQILPQSFELKQGENLQVASFLHATTKIKLKVSAEGTAKINAHLLKYAENTPFAVLDNSKEQVQTIEIPELPQTITPLQIYFDQPVTIHYFRQE